MPESENGWKEVAPHGNIMEALKSPISRHDQRFQGLKERLASSGTRLEAQSKSGRDDYDETETGGTLPAPGEVRVDETREEFVESSVRCERRTSRVQ